MILISSFILFFVLATIDAQNRCLNNAECINIFNCPEKIAILRGPQPLSQQTLQDLRNSQCGIEGKNPKVCCNQADPRITVDPESIPNPPDVTNHPNLRMLDHQACGPVTRTKIVNGHKTAILQYPWMTLIAYQRTGRPNPEFLCAGTIISSHYILTAAHCVASLPRDIRLVSVRVGDHDVSKERDCELDNNGLEVLCAERYQDFGVANVYVHPDYSKTKQHNDIALIRLNNVINFRPHIRPICLPFGSAINLTHSRAVVTGWGMTEFDLRSSELLQAKLPVVHNEQCKEVYKPSREIWYKQLCAGGQMNVDSCNGDSGGPLQATNTYNGRSVRMIQYGVVSYGLMPCGIEGVPGVYSRVAYYVDWILNTMTD